MSWMYAMRLLCGLCIPKDTFQRLFGCCWCDSLFWLAVMVINFQTNTNSLILRALETGLPLALSGKLNSTAVFFPHHFPGNT